MENALKIVVAGEVDAGKSTLIGRMLFDTGSLHAGEMEKGMEFAHLLDGLEEERVGQLTIDTTQAFCRCGREGFLFIDVPGHEELLKNMLCGTSYSHSAMLVVDVNKSLEPGTVRHIAILKFLGITNILLALNKMDTAGFSSASFMRAQEEIVTYLAGVGMQARYVVPVSALKGENIVKRSPRMPWHKGPCLTAALGSLARGKVRRQVPGFYFPVQDAYKRGGKTIFVGTAISGRIRKNDLIRVFPAGTENRITAIRVMGKCLSSACGPAALGVEVARGDGIGRGTILYKDAAVLAATEISARLLCTAPIQRGDTLRFSCVSQHTMALIKEILPAGKEALQKGDIAQVVLSTQEPVASTGDAHIEELGRFVLKKEKGICAVGFIG